MAQYRMPTSDEVVDELTKDLEKHCTPNKSDPSPDPASSSKNIPETSEDTACAENWEETDNQEESRHSEADVDDDIDEEALKEAESSLTEGELLERHAKSKEFKERGNQEFRDNLYKESVNTYTEALRLCPLKYASDRAVLFCNRAAAKIKLKRNETAICDCSKAIELNPGYIRAYHRRATLYEESEKLNEALEDYKKLLELDPKHLEAQNAVQRLPPKIAEMNEKLKEEMMGKLKDLGNMFLKPFGLSTNNFKMQQDPKTGGYSINFQQ